MDGLLIQQLETSLGASRSCLKWISSYFFNRSFVVFISNSQSTPFSFTFGVLQGSVLGPLLFILYTSELPRIISSFSLQSQLHADDSYIFTSFPKYESSSAISEISSCFGEIISWSDSMFLKLNPSKLDLRYFSKSSRLIKPLPPVTILSNLSLAPSSITHSLGSTFDSSLSLIPQIKSAAKSSFCHLHRIKQLNFFLDNPTLKLLVSSLILSSFDYCYILYCGLPETTLHPLTKTSNSAARLVSGTHKFSRLTHTLISLHWLPLKKVSFQKLHSHV